MGRVNIVDITTIALIYNYKATHSHSMMLSHEKIQEYAQIVDEILDEMNSSFSGVYPFDFSKSIYFNTQDDNDNWYSIIKPDIDIEMAEITYIWKGSYDLEKASKNENALAVLGIKMDGNVMKKIENVKVKQFVKRDND